MRTRSWGSQTSHLEVIRVDQPTFNIIQPYSTKLKVDESCEILCEVGPGPATCTVSGRNAGGVFASLGCRHRAS